MTLCVYKSARMCKCMCGFMRVSECVFVSLRVCVNTHSFASRSRSLLWKSVFMHLFMIVSQSGSCVGTQDLSRMKMSHLKTEISPHQNTFIKNQDNRVNQSYSSERSGDRVLVLVYFATINSMSLVLITSFIL